MKNMFLSTMVCTVMLQVLSITADGASSNRLLFKLLSSGSGSESGVVPHKIRNPFSDDELYVGWFLYSYTFNPILSSRKMASVTGLYMVPAFKFLQANWAYGNCKPVQRPRINKTIMVFAKLRPESLTALSSLLNKL